MNESAELLCKYADARAQELTRQIQKKEAIGLDTQHLRLEFLFTLLDPRLLIVEEVMRRAPSGDGGYERDHIRNGLIKTLENLTMERPAPHGTGLALDTFADGSQSATTVAKMILHKVILQKVAHARRSAQRDTALLPDYHAQMRSAPSAEQQYEDTQRAATVGADVPNSVLSDAKKRTHQLHMGPRTRVGARLLHETFNIPPISPPPDRRTRSQVARKIAEHPQVVRDSLLAAIDGTPAVGAVGALWSQFSREQMEILADREDRTALTVVTAALSPPVQLAAGERSSLTGAVLQGSRNTKWAPIARGMVRCWVAEFTGRPLALGEAPECGPPVDDWMNAAQAVLRFGGAPLGSRVTTTFDVDRRIRRIVEDVRGNY